jgi:hypothetical protein
MIASVNGMSLERAQSFIERFPAPGLFLDELEDVHQEESTKEQLAKRKRGQGTDGECWVMRQTAKDNEEGATVRPIGQALSTTMWNLFTAKDYPKTAKSSKSVTEA